MCVIIDKPAMLKEKLQNGINLFTGAGFSKLPDLDGRVLPDAADLCDEICKQFSLSSTYDNNLEKISNIVNRRAKQQFQDYLREKYTVSSYNPLYDALNLVSINSYITTNIDNIIQCVMDNSTKYSLHDIAEYGANKRSQTTIPYIALHGNVKDISSHLYFGKSELANVDSDNRDLFDAMRAKLLDAPTLFWGYGFHDNAVERAISKFLEDGAKEIWIMCRPGDGNIDYFRDLGCYVIEGTTENFLQWLQKNCSETDTSTTQDTGDLDSIKHYRIPSRNEIETVSQEDYYVNGSTHWYCILSKFPYETKWVNELYESSLAHKNTIAVGIPFSGKTTLMMQLAAKKESDYKYAVSDLTEKEAKRIVNVLGTRKAVIFVDNCCDDISATKVFMSQPNITFIGFADDFLLESTTHLLDSVNYNRIDIGELEIDEAQGIYQKIPQAHRTDSFTYKQDDSEKFSMLEMLNQNVKNVLSEKRIYSLLDRVKNASYEGFQVIALATYLVHNKSSLNMDVLCSFFNTTDYSKIQGIITTTQGYLQDLDIDLLPDAEDQNYYCLRSNLFAYLAFKVFSSKFRHEFGEVVRNLILEVSPYKIYRYHVFKRSAYDARFFKAIFDCPVHDLYEHVFRIDNNAYTLQQWALYKAYLRDYSGAFADIDTAINMNPNNFSIRNSRAIILFEANKDKKSELAEDGMHEAMEILKKCYFSDKRKVYHAQKFSEFAIYLNDEWNDSSYLQQAKDWLQDVYDTGESKSATTKRLLKETKAKCAKISND